MIAVFAKLLRYNEATKQGARMNAFIRLLYSLLIAVSVVIFVAVTIYSFYQSPKAPEYPRYEPSTLNYNDPGYAEEQARLNKEADARQKDYEKKLKEHHEKRKPYHRDVTILLLILSVMVLGIGLWLMPRSEVIGEGMALGSIATIIYTIISASIAEARILRFLAVTLLLLGSLVIAQSRFGSSKRSH
jgi:hypothetical protein